MNRRSILLMSVLGIFALSTISGCIAPSQENALTWAVKAATGRLTQTTPAEWQDVVARINTIAPEAGLELTAEQAAALVEFLQINNLNSIQQILTLIQQAEADPSVIETLQIPDSALELFASDFGFDFTSLIAALGG